MKIVRAVPMSLRDLGEAYVREPYVGEPCV